MAYRRISCSRFVDFGWRTLLVALLVLSIHQVQSRVYANEQAPGIANSIVVRKAAYHGAITEDAAPLDYVEFDGSLFFSSEDRLLRLDGVNESVVDHPLPAGTGDGVLLGAEFAIFDNTLFFHAGRDYEGRRATFLHRLSNTNDVPERIDIPELPDPGWSDVVPSAYPDNTNGFSEFNNRLYFFANRGTTGVFNPTTTPMLYSLDSASSDPRLSEWNNVRTLNFQPSMQSTPNGLLLSAEFAVGRGSNSGGIFYWLSELPQTDFYDDRILNDSYYDTSNIIYFDGSLFFPGKNDKTVSPDVVLGPHPGSPGLFRPTTQWQTELYRFDINSGSPMWYEINPTPWLGDPSGYCSGDPCSSHPENFVVANDVLYFQASPDGITRELHRLPLADGLPQVMPLNSGGPSQGKPLAGIRGRLWFGADIGNGFDLHMMDHDGVAPIPLGVGESIARSARALTGYRDRVVFAARDDNNDWWTFMVNLGEDSPSPLDVKVTVNERQYPEIPGLEVTRGARIRVSCATTNFTSRVLSPVRIRLRDERRTKPGGKGNDSLRTSHSRWFAPKGKTKNASCNIKSLKPGESAVCSLTTRVAPGKHRFRCLAAASGKGKKPKTRLRGSDIAYVTGRNFTKTDPVISVDSLSVDEGALASVSVRLSIPSRDVVNVTVRTADGSAKEGSDYLSVTRRLVFEPGETEKQVEVFTVDDLVIEQTEVFRLVLTEPLNARIDGQGVVTILDKDVPALTISGSDDWREGEQDPFAHFIVSLSQAIDEDVSVTVLTEDSSAISGSDYVALSETVLIPAGSLSKTVSVEILDDDFAEDEEYFFVRLSDLSENARFGESSSRYIFVQITDNDLPMVHVAGTVTGAEGDANGPFADVIVFVVGGYFDAPITVELTTEDLSAKAGSDYVPIRETVVLSPFSPYFTSVEVLDDADIENPEKIKLVLRILDGNAVLAPPESNSPIVIIDNDGPARIDIEPETFAVEGGVGSVSVSIYRSGARDETVSAVVSTKDGSAVAGEDYTALSETVIFPAGNNQRNYFFGGTRIDILDDAVPEPNEVFKAVLSNPSNNVVLGNRESEVEINDDD